MVAAPDGTTGFEVRSGSRRVSCIVLDDALVAASGVAGPLSPLSRRNAFDRFRTLIDAAAKLKMQELPAGAAGPVVLTRDDLRRVPPQTGVPTFGTAPRPPARPAEPGAPAPVVRPT
jgi:hypothetical protein